MSTDVSRGGAQVGLDREGGGAIERCRGGLAECDPAEMESKQVHQIANPVDWSELAQRRHPASLDQEEVKVAVRPAELEDHLVRAQITDGCGRIQRDASDEGRLQRIDPREPAQAFRGRSPFRDLGGSKGAG